MYIRYGFNSLVMESMLRQKAQGSGTRKWWVARRFGVCLLSFERRGTQQGFAEAVLDTRTVAQRHPRGIFTLSHFDDRQHRSGRAGSVGSHSSSCGRVDTVVT